MNFNNFKKDTPEQLREFIYKYKLKRDKGDYCVAEFYVVLRAAVDENTFWLLNNLEYFVGEAQRIVTLFEEAENDKQFQEVKVVLEAKEQELGAYKKTISTLQELQPIINEQNQLKNQIQEQYRKTIAYAIFFGFSFSFCCYSTFCYFLQNLTDMTEIENTHVADLKQILGSISAIATTLSGVSPQNNQTPGYNQFDTNLGTSYQQTMLKLNSSNGVTNNQVSSGIVDTAISQLNDLQSQVIEKATKNLPQLASNFLAQRTLKFMGLGGFVTTGFSGWLIYRSFSKIQQHKTALSNVEQELEKKVSDLIDQNTREQSENFAAAFRRTFD